MIRRMGAIAIVVSMVTTTSALAQVDHHEKEAVERAIKTLKTCKKIDDIVCKSLPARLQARGELAVPALLEVFSALPMAGKLLAIVALRGITNSAATAGLVKLVRGDDLVIKALILPALGEREGKQVDKALVEALRGKRATIRQAAAEALGKSRTKRQHKLVVPALIKALKDENESVRLAAMESLGFLGAQEALPPIIEALKKGENARVRRAAVFALRFLGDIRACPALIEALRDDDDLVTREAEGALNKLTGVAFGPDYFLWKAWWKNNRDKLLKHKVTKK